MQRWKRAEADAVFSPLRDLELISWSITIYMRYDPFFWFQSLPLELKLLYPLQFGHHPAARVVSIYGERLLQSINHILHTASADTPSFSIATHQRSNTKVSPKSR